MGRINGWTIGGAVLGIGSAIFSIAKGIADAKETDRKQTEKIEKAVSDYMESNALKSGSEE